MTFGTLTTVLAYSVVTMGAKFFGHLIDPAVRSLALGALVGMLLFLTRTRSVALRLSAWKIVVCAALAMPILAACVPPLHVALPFAARIPNFEAVVAQQTAPRPTVKASNLVKQQTGLAPLTSAVATAPQSAQIPVSFPTRRITISWWGIAGSIYLTIAACLAIRFALGWFLSRKLRQAAETIEEHGSIARFESLAAGFGIVKTPRLAASERLVVPLTCGVAPPVVLLPAEWREWDEQTLNAVMTHELSHVARGDALTERLALVHRIFFWFSPLAWWLPRHLADLAEEASDQAAIAAGTEPSKYAEILLGFLNDLSFASKRVNWQGVAMAQAGRAEKRLDRILKGGMIMTNRVNKPLIALILFSSVPVILLAASLQPRRLGHQIELGHYPSAPSARQSVAQQAPSAVPAVPAVAPTSGPQPMPELHPSVTAIPAVAPFAVVTPTPMPRPMPVVSVSPVVRVMVVPRVLPFVTPVQEAAPTARHSASSYSFSTDGDDAYAIISGKSSTMSGSFGGADFKQLEALHEKLNADFIWFQRDGKSYIITDPGMVQRAEAAFAAQSELGEKQGEIGESQGSLGELQGVLGEQQGLLSQQMAEVHANLGNLKIQMPDISKEMQAVQEQTRELSEELNKKNLDEMRVNTEQMRAEIEKASKEIAEARARSGAFQAPDAATMNEAMRQARISMEEQMSKFSAAQEKLGEQQEALGRVQADLGSQQAKASEKAQAEIKAMIDEALAKGIAKPTPKP
ncbi:MAG TPA: M56 family metallopeptidase [Candidatus Acidoferrales bacterium]